MTGIATDDWFIGDAVVRRAMSGDREAFTSLVAMYDSSMARVAYVVSSDPDLARDAVQAACYWPVHPDYTPDGTRITFVKGTVGSSEPWVMATVAADGSDVQPATSSGYVGGLHPRFRPTP